MISVVVPVYKVEKYIEKCVESILNQSFKDFELLLIDDGSPDNCPHICDEYAKKYSNIRVIHKENGGLSDARNTGIICAKGEYITFIDSDDFVSDCYLETLYGLLIRHGADIAVCGIEVYKKDCEIKSKAEGSIHIFSGTEAFEQMLYQRFIDTSACAILLKTQLANENLFPVGRYHEDDFTTYKYYLHSKKVVITTQKLYYYLQRQGSIMRMFGKANLDEMEALENLINVCQTYYPAYIDAAKSKKYSVYCQMSNIKKKKLENTIKEYLKMEALNVILNSKCRIKNRVAAMIIKLNYKLFLWLMKKYKDI